MLLSLIKYIHRFNYMILKIKKIYDKLVYFLLDKIRDYQEYKKLEKIFNSITIDCAIDCGFHLGFYSKKILKIKSFNGDIYGFEPNNDIYNLSTKKFYKNKNINLFNYAVSNKNEITDFFITAGSQFSSLYKPVDTYHKNINKKSEIHDIVKVNNIRLDSLQNLFIYNTIFLKIDVQGGEIQVLEGIENLLHKIVGIQLEASFEPIYSNYSSFFKINEWMFKNNFKLNSIVNNNNGHFPYLFDTDFIYLNKSFFDDI